MEATVPLDHADSIATATRLPRRLHASQRVAAGNRILVVAPQPFYQDRGTPIALYHVLMAMLELGYEIDLISFPLGRRLEDRRINHIQIANPLRFRSVPIGASLKKLFLDMLLLTRAIRQLRRHDYCCVHAVEEAAWLLLVPARFSRTPLVYDMQSSIPEQLESLPVLGTAPVRHLLRWCEALLLRRVDFVAASAGLGPQVRARAPLVPRREWMFPDRPRFDVTDGTTEQSAHRPEPLRRVLDLPMEARILVYSGNFKAYQGLPLLLASLGRIVAREPRTLLVLVGAEDEREAARTKACLPPELRDHVRIVGRQPRERVQLYLMAADVLVSPRISGENAPLKIFDYLGAGRPIVATDIIAHRAVLQDDLAVLVEPHAAALAAGVIRLMHDADLAQRMSDAANARRERLGWPAFVAEVDAIYGQITERRS